MDGIEFGQLGNPGIADLRNVGCGFADKGGEQLFVGGGPRDLLHPHFNVGVFAFEVRDHLPHYLPFAAEPPKFELHVVLGRLVAAAGCPKGQERQEQAGYLKALPGPPLRIPPASRLQIRPA